jgi:primosomal protein N' (replication factor Y)
VVGARSALFLPFANLRMIVVDEEHDGSYKQEEGVLYHARDMAVARAKFAKAAIILASATPALETMRNARLGRYAHIRLPARPGAAVLPPISTIDLREHPPQSGCWLSPPLIEAIDQTLKQDEQCLLFLNRRGYAPLTICRACGAKMQAPDSATYLVEHRYTGRLICHLTGYSIPKPAACPTCGAKDSLHPIGPGVERLSEEVTALFPQARIEIFSSDTAKTAEEVRTLIARMEQGDIDILIGTQMAAKGHNFPHLTLVGVVDADMGLHGADLRAGERTYQTLAQVAGRAGRADKPGRAILQTHQPDHEAILALCSGVRETFIDAELSLREDMGFPPYGRLAALIFSAPSEQEAQNAARDFVAAAPIVEGVDVWGPSEPPLGRVRGRWRRRLLLRAEPHIDLSAMVSAWRTRIKLPNNIRLKVDIDPYSFL